MDKDIIPLLFNDNSMTDSLVESIQSELNQESSFLIAKKDVEKIISKRNEILVEKGLIDFSVEYLIKGANLLLKESLKKTEWHIEMVAFFDIFYEVRKNTPLFIEDDTIFSKIKELLAFFDSDLNHVAGYFETNLNWYEEWLDEQAETR